MCVCVCVRVLFVVCFLVITDNAVRHLFSDDPTALPRTPKTHAKSQARNTSREQDEATSRRKSPNVKRQGVVEKRQKVESITDISSEKGVFTDSRPRGALIPSKSAAPNAHSQLFTDSKPPVITIPTLANIKLSPSHTSGCNSDKDINNSRHTPNPNPHKSNVLKVPEASSTVCESVDTKLITPHSNAGNPGESVRLVKMGSNKRDLTVSIKLNTSGEVRRNTPSASMSSMEEQDNYIINCVANVIHNR